MANRYIGNFNNNIDKTIKKIVNSSISSRYSQGKGAFNFSSGGPTQPSPSTINRNKLSNISPNIKTKIYNVDGKQVIYAGNRQNAPPVKLVKKVYAKIPDNKNFPVVFQTKKQYLKEYIRNQEIVNNTKFSKTEKEQYVKKELKDMQPVVSRYTTEHNDYMPPKTVFFTDNNYNKNNKSFEMSANHEYWHEKTEGNKQAQDDEIAAEQYAKDKVSKNRNQVYLSVKRLPRPKNQQERELRRFLMQRQKEENKKLIGAPYVVGNYPYTRDVTFLGKWPPNMDFSQDDNITHLSNLLTHEETHSILDEEFPDDYSEKQTVSQQLDNISIPRKFVLNEKETKGLLMNPLSASTINMPVAKLTSPTYTDDPTTPEFYTAIIVGEVLQKMEDKKQKQLENQDEGKNRLNRMQLERLKNIPNVYYYPKPIITPKPIYIVDEDVNEKQITTKPDNVFQTQVKNRAHNLLKRYPHLISEFEKMSPSSGVVFYQYGGPKGKQIFHGQHGEGKTPEGEKISMTFVDVAPDKELKGREYQYSDIASTTFHELGHEKQFRNIDGFKMRSNEIVLTGSEPIEEYSSESSEKEAEKYAETQTTNINKGRLKKTRVFLTPEEVTTIQSLPENEIKEKQKIGELPTHEQLVQRAKEYHKQIEENKTAGIELLEDVSKNSTFKLISSTKVKDTYQNQKGQKILVAANVREKTNVDDIAYYVDSLGNKTLSKNSSFIVVDNANDVSRFTGSSLAARNFRQNESNNKPPTYAYYSSGLGSYKDNFVFVPRATKEPEVVIHEIGHRLVEGQVMREYDKQQLSPDTAPTKYGETNKGEDLADSFAYWVLPYEQTRRQALKNTLEKRKDIFNKILKHKVKEEPSLREVEFQNQTPEYYIQEELEKQKEQSEDVSKDRYTTDDFLPTVDKGIKVESEGTRTFYEHDSRRPNQVDINIYKKPMYLSGTFNDLFTKGEHIQIVNPLRNEVVRDIQRVGNVARIDAMTGREEDIVNVPLTTDILYEPWLEDRGSLKFSAPPNAPPMLQNQMLKLATEEDEVIVLDESKDRVYCKHEDIELYSEHGWNNKAIFECMKCKKKFEIEKMIGENKK